jgi:hypothetical protein
MHTFFSLRLLLCLIIFAAHSHCVMAHGAALVNQVEAAQCAEPPIGETKTCENESACICKGALISDSLPSFLVDGDLTDYLLVSYPGLGGSDVALRERASRKILHALTAPFTGADARIQLQSFQL